MDSATWDERYGSSEFVWKTEPNQFLVAEVAGMAPGRALDLACGEGRNAVWLAQQGWRVTGVDFSPVGLAKAGRLAREHGLEVEWIEADVVEWEPPGASFDLVVVLYLHLPAGARRRALGHVRDALAEGGTVLLVGHDASNLLHGYGGPQDPAVLCTAEEIARDLDGLHIVRAETVERRVDHEDGPKVALDALVRAERPRS